LAQQFTFQEADGTETPTGTGLTLVAHRCGLKIGFAGEQVAASGLVAERILGLQCSKQTGNGKQHQALCHDAKMDFFIGMPCGWVLHRA
jgi:hypothetical protein